MKGASAGVEFLGWILLTVFTIGVIVILLATFLPDIFGSTVCQGAQFEDNNKLFNDAIGATASVTIKDFSVRSCIEYMDFNAVECKLSVRTSRATSTEVQKFCYEILVVGQNSGNCNDVVVDKNICDSHKGNFYALPASPDVFEIKLNDRGINEKPIDLKLKPGPYLVEIGPYSLNFKKK